MKELLLALTVVVMASSDANPGADPLLLYNTLPYPHPYAGPGYGYQRIIVPQQASPFQHGLESVYNKQLVSRNNECFNSLGVQVNLTSTGVTLI